MGIAYTYFKVKIVEPCIVLAAKLLNKSAGILF